MAVRGNHDLNAPFPAGVIDLHLNVVSFGGLKFGGFGGSWRYKSRGYNLYTQEEAERLLESIPPVDIFVAHNSPAGVHERDSDAHQGFRTFNAYIRRASPSYFIHGHQHNDNSAVIAKSRIVGAIGERLIEISP